MAEARAATPDNRGTREPQRVGAKPLLYNHPATLSFDVLALSGYLLHSLLKLKATYILLICSPHGGGALSHLCTMGGGTRPTYARCIGSKRE